MINKETVLVLGAGASYPYEFPLGYDLLLHAYHNLMPDNEVYEVIRASTDFSATKIEAFRTQMYNSNMNSIDAFVMNREEFIHLGRWVIAGYLIKQEDPKVLMSREAPKEKGKKRWYNYLYQRLLGHNLEDFLQNRLKIITFNYDRSLEYFLYYSLKNSYDPSELMLKKAVMSIPIIHVYGQLSFPHFIEPGGFGGYNTDLINRLAYAVSNIRIMADPEDTSPEQEEAVDAIRNADILCFLGFGFHETNINRLGLAGFAHPAKRIYGTTYSLGNAERNSIHKTLKNLSGIDSNRINLQDMDCLTLLRELPVLH